MISIIVSTYKPNVLDKFKEKVKKTIGVDYEIIPIHNPGIMSLCKAYNIGIGLAKYPYLCFSHDDIVFNLQGWGEHVINAFSKDDELGLVGIAGNSYKSWVPTGWYFPDDTRFCRMDMYQGEGCGGTTHHIRNQPSNSDFSEVVTLDGCWFCTTQKVVSEFKFDEELLTGYHCYDLDYAFQVGSKYKIQVLYNMEIIHLSHGDYTREWLIETFKLHNKWKNKLPISISNPTKDEIAYNEFNSYLFILGKTSENNIYLFKMLQILYSIRLLRLVGLKKWTYLQKWTWGAILRKITKSI